MNWVLHSRLLAQRLNTIRPSPRLNQFPIDLQFIQANYSPCLYKATLASRETARNQLHMIHGVNRGRVLIISVKVRSVVRAPRFRIHTYENTQEAGNLRHLHQYAEAGLGADFDAVALGVFDEEDALAVMPGGDVGRLDVVGVHVLLRLFDVLDLERAVVGWH